MRLLLDTCAFPWFQADSPQLSPAARAWILDAENEVYLSAVSVWEIARKYALGGISLPSHPSTLIPAVHRESGVSHSRKQTHWPPRSCSFSTKTHSIEC